MKKESKEIISKINNSLLRKESEDVIMGYIEDLLMEEIGECYFHSTYEDDNFILEVKSNENRIDDLKLFIYEDDDDDGKELEIPDEILERLDNVADEMDREDEAMKETYDCLNSYYWNTRL